MIESCQKCLDQFGQEPSSYGDSADELIAYYKHRVFHKGEDIEVPWFWKEEIYDE